MKFLVFCFVLFIFELLNFMFLFEQSSFYFNHLLISLNHFSKEVIWSFNWDICLHTYLHCFHYILACIIIECNFTFYIIIYLELFGTFRDINVVFIYHSHMLSEWHFALLFDKFGGFKSIVKTLFDFVNSFSDLVLIVDFLKTKFLKFFFVELFFSHIL